MAIGGIPSAACVWGATARGPNHRTTAITEQRPAGECRAPNSDQIREHSDAHRPLRPPADEHRAHVTGGETEVSGAERGCRTHGQALAERG